MASDNDEFGAFLLGFIVGGVAGAVVSLLFAPQTGEETRAMLQEKSIELRDRATENAGEAASRLDAAAAEARAKADELTRKARAQADELAKKARAQAEEIKKVVEERRAAKPGSAS